LRSKMECEGTGFVPFFIAPMNKVLRAEIESILKDKFSESAFSDCFLIEMTEHDRKLEIFIDSDREVTFDTCRALSRAIEDYLDSSRILGAKYTLEVSSAGVGRPLKLRRQYEKNKGRILKVETGKASEFRGELINVTDKGIQLKTRKKNKPPGELVQIAWQDIKKSTVQPTFK
jgi:ribosome maturation factor RimP